MKVDCQWIEKNLEALSFERLSPEDDFRARTHLESCSHCREKVADLKLVDPLVKRLLRENLAIARTPRRRRSPVLIGAFGTGLAAIIILIIISTMSRVSNVPRLQSPPAVASVPAAADVTSIPKIGEPGAQDRAKPEPGTPDQPATDTSKPNPSGNPQEFLVVDPAGYSRTLIDFREHVLIFGVWSSSQPRTVSSLQRVYEVLSRNSKLRILGVALAKEARPAASTFPIAYNQGSTLLGAKSAEFLVVDAQGVVRARGSLLDSPANVVSSIQATLNQLGIK